MRERRLWPAKRRIALRGGRRQPDYAGLPIILIIDEDVHSRELVATVLQEIGVSILEAVDVREALERAVAEPRPHLILIDLHLSDGSALDVVRALKRDRRSRHIPIAALGREISAPERQAATIAGCAAFIDEPVLPDDVVALARRLLAG